MIQSYSPKENEIELYKELDGVYDFLEQIYKLYGRMRFRGAGFMKVPTPELETIGEESVAEHLFSCTLLWKLLSGVLKQNGINVDSETISNMVLIHDIGEIEQGDVSAVLQLQGKGKDRKNVEDKAFEEISSLLPQSSGKLIKETNERYEREKNNPTTNDKEVLIAKIIDTLQGDHYVTTNSIDLVGFTDTHQKIISIKLYPYVLRLIEILEKEKNKIGSEFMKSMIRHHLFNYEKKGSYLSSPEVFNK